jgi:RimJ/RimL family protein N-acetyltransferase
MQVTIPTLRTERLNLVPPHHSHLATYEALYGSPEVMRHIAEPFDKQAAARLLAAHAGSWVLHGFGGWCVEERATGAVIGICGLRRSEQGDDVDIGWILQPSSWGRGYATEMTEAAIQYAFQHVGASQIVARIAPENASSIAVARKLGMQLEQKSSADTTLVFARSSLHRRTQ